MRYERAIENSNPAPGFKITQKSPRMPSASARSRVPSRASDARRRHRPRTREDAREDARTTRRDPRTRANDPARSFPRVLPSHGLFTRKVRVGRVHDRDRARGRSTSTRHHRSSSAMPSMGQGRVQYVMDLRTPSLRSRPSIRRSSRRAATSTTIRALWSSFISRHGPRDRRIRAQAVRISSPRTPSRAPAGIDDAPKERRPLRRDGAHRPITH